MVGNSLLGDFTAGTRGEVARFEADWAIPSWPEGMNATLSLQQVGIKHFDSCFSPSAHRDASARCDAILYSRVVGRFDPRLRASARCVVSCCSTSAL